MILVPSLLPLVVDLKVHKRQSFSIFLFFLFVLICSDLCADRSGPPQIEKEAIKTPGMSYGEAVVYGFVEGVTEFLPVSSTGHLILVSEMMPSRNQGKEMEQAINAYIIVIQAGAILAVALIYRRELWSILLGILGLDPRGKRLGVNLIIAFCPAALIGPFLDDLIESLLFGLLPIAIALFAGALLMHWAESRKKKAGNGVENPEKSLEDLNFKSSLFIGFMQCFAMWPGTSRSMMTIVGGYLVGLERAKAAEFSFLLGLITLTAAAGYKGMTKWEVMSSNLELGPVFLGCLVAGASAAVSVVWLVGYLSRRGLGIFVWYRLILSMVIFCIYYTS